eukprot:GILJ01004951.1.p1 GENE.GILJ01004951.1~~GILJ01004951.1.p1  ORF type:complete len:358 (-),score=40.56 GILJ01004951.1:241-1275(-)
MATSFLLPEVDAAVTLCIDETHVQQFLKQGLLIIRNVMREEELEALKRETADLITKIHTSQYQQNDHKEDFIFQNDRSTERRIPFRVEHVVDKLPSVKALLGHPYILRAVQKIQGRNFIPTCDSLVFKSEGNGAAVRWHRDCGSRYVNGAPLIDMGFYLDEASVAAGNCLWVVPGSNQWPDTLAGMMISHLTDQGKGFKTDGSVPVELGPGDCLFHNVLLVHGSPACQSPLRRTVYLEFRPAETELQIGPHVPEFVFLKQKVLRASVAHRITTSYAKDEDPFVYESDLNVPEAQNPCGSVEQSAENEDGCPARGSSENQSDNVQFRLPAAQYWKGTFSPKQLIY